MFGKEGLENGVPEAEGPQFSGYKYHGIPEKTFSQFFGSENVFEEIFRERLYDSSTGQQLNDYHALRPKPIQMPKQNKIIKLTLEEIYAGTTRRIPHSRTIIEPGTESETRVLKEFLHIMIPPGTKNNTKFLFSKRGNQAPNTIPADLEFTVEFVPHAIFSVDNSNNLCYTHEISLVQALSGSIISINTLDGRKLQVSVPEIIHPMYKKIIKSEGMPLPFDVIANPNLRYQTADLIIDFKIEFPKYLNLKQKAQIKSILV